MQYYAEGRSIYDFYTYHYVGVDQMTGDALYTLDASKKEAASNAGELVTINGTDYTKDTTYGLRDYHGHADPTVYGSFHTNFAWKGLSLSMLFTYSLGGKIYDGIYASLMSMGSATSGDALHADAANAWKAAPEGMTESSSNRIDPNGVPRLDFTRDSQLNATSDRWLTNASYLVFKNISLTYDLPKNWLNCFAGAINGVQLKVSAENLFTLSARKGLNPQYLNTNLENSSENIGSVQTTYVTARVFNIGLAVNF